MGKLPTRCPACGSKLRIKALECTSCKTRVEGNFDIQPLCDLDDEDMEMLFLFLKTRGNLSEVSKRLGVSYPTARLRFEEFLKKVGIEPTFSQDELMGILDLLEKGEITADEAEKRIKNLK
ncbi:MAG TPA: DUF2089 domain-containing protein [Candidatus Hydrothermia bacterium]|mgnify:CR=1 FL=1|nr:DUF2089 domain-containing protein [Candidatus Hydrothermae bacterium]MDD3649102.1 DUF2089 domain-containing protein [Candidatus Hydrothermia bacterium]MDD5572927.1 DUF2089 domain-containing protein [Candidatus Hydrothermia bacterium]HOK23041.1 DUF2089 domain-containing protein [Candidatus Hydrothermia bacterium]HOL23699.1 DUF2089 domain-containing protein [Candidatus Hydrothermia bacterium]